MMRRFSGAFCFLTAVGVLMIPGVVQAQMPGTWQDFSATFPTETTPGSVTVVLVDHLGNTVVPIAGHPVPGLDDYVGRPGFDARTGGAFANQDMRNFSASYTVGAETVVNTFPIEGDPAPWAEVHNQTYFIPSLTDDGYLRVADENAGGNENNNVAWPKQYDGPWDSLNLNFDIRISQGDPLINDKADGFGFKWINTATNGDSGAFYTAGEEPNLAGSLGIGFDIWDNGAATNDIGASGLSATTSLSLHYGSWLKTVNLMDPANEGLASAFPLETGEPINVTVIVTPGSDLTPTLDGGSSFTSRGSVALTEGPGGNDFMRLAPEVGSQLGIIAFNDTVSAPEIHASFNFRALNGDGTRADGMSFLLAPATTYPDADSIPNYGAPGGVEEANLAGAFGVGFDTFNNDVDPQDDPEGMPSVGNHVSVHFNDAKVSQTDFALADFDILTDDPEVWHTANIVINGDNVTVELIDGTDGSEHLAFAGAIPGLSGLGEVRAVFGARTGGAFDNYDIDNVHIEGVPEPGTLTLIGLAGALLLGWRRRRGA